MSDKNDDKSSVFSLINIGGGKLLNSLYKDLAEKGISKVGEALGTVLDLSNSVLLPIKLLNEKTKIIFQENINKYRRRIESIPDEKICEVPPEIGIPILDKLTYT